jgi:ribokinase
MQSLESDYGGHCPGGIEELGLRERISKLTVSVLPDFYFDRIVLVPSLRNLFRQIELKAASGGGNLRGLIQTEVRGGNATNLAFALSSLSARTNLYCVGNAVTRAVLSKHPAGCKVRVIDGEPGYTTALEFTFKGKPVNVMLSDVGDISNFGGRKLARNDIENLKRSDCVALVNWSSNAKGNELARRVFGLSGREGRLNFIDLADATGAESRVRGLARNIRDQGLVDVISLNENEARIIARTLSVGGLRRSYDRRDVIRVSNLLHGSLHVGVDVHTPIGSASSTNQGDVWVDSFGKVSGFVTGAGDVWDAGDIIGHLLAFKAEDRLRFANACAHLYLTGKNARLPTLREVTHFAGL